MGYWYKPITGEDELKFRECSFFKSENGYYGFGHFWDYLSDGLKYGINYIIYTKEQIEELPYPTYKMRSQKQLELPFIGI